MSQDLEKWLPPAELQPKDTNGNVNPDWPGNPANFIRAKEKQADYAWAALSVYLARNGAKIGYSTGQARPLDAPIAGPAGGPSGVIGKVRKRISSARTTLMAKYFDA
ncbi:hypothetical protein ACEPPN_008112 [Leptodophora sp. 'Broadleaf-Isolate-01']